MKNRLSQTFLLKKNNFSDELFDDYDFATTETIEVKKKNLFQIMLIFDENLYKLDAQPNRNNSNSKRWRRI
mgnify:CR=1 FL=1